MSEDTPVYYSEMKQQPIDVIRNGLTSEQLTGFYLGNTLKYLLRFKADAPGKGGSSDLKKARCYLDWLIELVAEEEVTR